MIKVTNTNIQLQTKLINCAKSGVLATKGALVGFSFGIAIEHIASNRVKQNYPVRVLCT